LTQLTRQSRKFTWAVLDAHVECFAFDELVPPFAKDLTSGQVVTRGQDGAAVWADSATREGTDVDARVRELSS
jgi:hypothetical protein